MTNKQTKYVITFLSVVSSIAGFIFTGICAYPYGIHWDSGWVFSHIYNDEHLYINRHYKIFCVNGNTGFRNESRIFYFIDLQNEEDYERKESSSAR